MSQWLLLLISFVYLLLLFLIAYWGERRAKKGRSIVNNPWVYALSLTVYCTAWTYFGSVGRALESGIDFLTIYIGPTLGMPIWWLITRKIILICRSLNITTIADFISSRYGKSSQLGVLVALVSIIGIIPYISLQLRAISDSFLVLTQHQSGDVLNLTSTGSIFQDTAFIVMIILIIFTILFGARNIQATERHEGLVSAIAFESLIKLFAFLFLGIFVVYFYYDGFGEIIKQISDKSSLEHVYTLEEDAGYLQWFSMCILSMCAFMFLPRQFQVAVVENVDTQHLKRAVWIFPLYLFLINLFVMPIALAGEILLDNQLNADTYVLAIPMYLEQDFLAILVYLGGFSAASSMIVVSTTALTVMMSNNLIMPLLVSIPVLKEKYTNRIGGILLFIRRFCVVIVLHLAYIFAEFVVGEIPLVSIGLISFVAITQFAPAMIGGIYWRRGNHLGAKAGIILGVLVWFYTLIFPLLTSVGMVSEQVIQQGPWGLHWLRPHTLFGLEGFGSITNGFFWSIFLNLTAYIGLSFAYNQNNKEANQAETFINIHKYIDDEGVFYWRAEAQIKELKYILDNFLGEEVVNQALKEYTQKYGDQWQNTENADANFIAFCEKLLAGTIGVVAARIMLANAVRQNHEIRISEVLRILKESQELIALNKELKEKSEALEQATEELRQVNENLVEMDQRKNEFISTVTHELRTPITSIRAFSEILYDNDDISLGEKKYFLNTIIKETHRTERLINQVLELERFESGKETLNLGPIKINEIIRESLSTFKQIIKEKSIKLALNLNDDIPVISGDKDRLMQVIINLISNAIKFCKKNNGEIKIYSELQKNQIMFYVFDNGRGISKELYELIFEKFFQAKDQNIRKPKGSGLGLAITKKILESHGGDIFIESEEGNYTKMIVKLPLQ